MRKLLERVAFLNILVRPLWSVQRRSKLHEKGAKTIPCEFSFQAHRINFSWDPLAAQKFFPYVIGVIVEEPM